MVDMRPVMWGIGLLLSAFAVMMTLPASADWISGGNDWPVFLAVAGLSLFCGQILAMANMQFRARQFSLRQGILLAVCGWLTLAAAGALPFMFAGPHLALTDALFEATSGITASGASVLRHLEREGAGILLWRALLQWMGGIGVLALSSLILPDLNVGGMEIFRRETARLDDRLLTRAMRLLLGIFAIYGGVTLLLGILLWVAGMTPFESLLHALSTISCGGFSSSDQSIQHWHNPGVDWVILGGMLIGGMPFYSFLRLFGRQWRGLFAHRQIRWYLGLIIASSLAITLWLVIEQDAKPLPALRHSLFAVTSVMTGTGFATRDWSLWTGFPLAMLFLLTFVGGCAGSTAGGIKIFRLQILLANARQQLDRLLRPHAVLLPRFDGRVMAESIGESVLGFLFVYILSFAILALALAFVGLDFAPAIGAAASALANLGPGISPSIGPMSGFGALPTAGKWLLCAGMMLGRLELFVVFALFNREFWRD